MRKHIYIYEIVNKETTGNSGKSKNEGPERLIQKQIMEVDMKKVKEKAIIIA